MTHTIAYRPSKIIRYTRVPSRRGTARRPDAYRCARCGGEWPLGGYDNEAAFVDHWCGLWAVLGRLTRRLRGTR